MRKSQHAEKWNACSRQLSFPAWETWQDGGGWTPVIKEGEHKNIGRKKKSENCQERTQRLFKETAREGTGKNPRTFEENSQGEDPSIFKDPLEKWRDQEKRKEEKWKKREKKKKKKVKHRKRRWWKKFEGFIISLYIVRVKEGRKEKEGKISERRPKARQILGKLGKWLFVLLILGQNWLCVSAAPEKPQRRTEAMVRMQQEVQVKGSRWAEEISRRWKQPKGEDRVEMKKEAKLLRCTLLNGSAWSTERKYMRRFNGKCDVFFGIEHRLMKEEMEEQFNEETKEGWSFTASAARITEETTGGEDRKHTSGGVFVAEEGNLGAGVGAEEGAIESIPENEGRIAQA